MSFVQALATVHPEVISILLRGPQSDAAGTAAKYTCVIHAKSDYEPNQLC